MSGVISRLLVDGDSSGHRELLIELAIESGVELIWVCNIAQAPPLPQADLQLTVHHVDLRNQAADIKIMNLAAPDSIVVTGDLGLASVCISRGAAALGPRGHWFYEEKMRERLETRHMFAAERRAGKKVSGPPGASRVDDRRFELELRDALKLGVKE